MLRSLIIALEKHISFAEENGVQLDQRFSYLLIHLVSNRPSVLAAAMEEYSDLRSLSIRVLHASFIGNTKRAGEIFDSIDSIVVAVEFLKTSQKLCGTVYLPLPLLQSICVVLSIWKDHNDDEADVKSAVKDFADALLEPDDEHSQNDNAGLANAKMQDNGTVDAVSVESVCI